MNQVNNFYSQTGFNLEDYHPAGNKLLPVLAWTRLVHTMTEKQREELDRGQKSETIMQIASSLHTGTMEPFRDPWFYREFADYVRSSGSSFFRIWYPFVGNGSELRSLMVALEDLQPIPPYAIEATDLDQRMLRFTFEGGHPEFTQEVLTSYRKTGDHAKNTGMEELAKKVEAIERQASGRVRFSKVSLSSIEPPGGSVDAILLRNVLCNWKTEERRRILDSVLSFLHPGGLICVGYREIHFLDPYKDQLSPLDVSEGIYQRLK